jgi:tripartite-type tricarboxylate transporter receptor subunit TctC
MPAVPTLSELGYPGYDVALWYGFVAPDNTPPALIARLNAALREAVKEPELKTKMAASDANILVRSAQEFGEFLFRERVKWAGQRKARRYSLSNTTGQVSCNGQCRRIDCAS